MFDARLEVGAVERLEIDTDLRYVVERGELEVHYQPIVSLTDALPKWRRLCGDSIRCAGLMAPAQFMLRADRADR